MNPRRIYAVFLRYFYILRTNPQRLLQIFVWGGLDVILWGFLTNYLNAVGNATFSFVPTLLGAVILLDFLSRVQQGVATPTLEDIWSNNLLNYFASPLKIGEYILGLIVASIATSAISLVVMVLLATLFGFSSFTYGVAVIGFLAVLFLFGITLGILAASIVLRFGPSAEWFVWPMTMMLSPFMGVFYPISVLPQWMQWISHLLPPSYVFEGVRAIVYGKGFLVVDLLIALTLAVIYIALAGFLFSYVYKIIVRKGLLARYSAEGL